MSHDGGQTCRCMVTHRPHPLELHRHHVLPLYLGGSDTEDNIVWICPTGHSGIHELLRHMVKADRPLTDHELRAMYDVPVSEYAAQVARAGFTAYAAGRGTTTTQGELT